MAKSEDGVRQTLDGYDLKHMVWAGLVWLRQHQAMVNALNVFPVPDGDTGTNMTLTMTSAWEEIAELQEPMVGRMASKMAHGALMGARGNSGVILSQIWRGFARGLDDKAHLESADIATAMRMAAETAYKGVVKPVEGTILTVVREVAEDIGAVATNVVDIEQIFLRMVQQAQASVARTPSLLPVLRQAGVVDSGGQGLTVILEGMWRYLKGLPLDEPEQVAQETGVSVGIEEALDADHIHFDSNYPYDVQFIVVGQDMDVAGIRAQIEQMGDCALTVGDAVTIKVHVHVPDPGVPISYGASLGSLRDVVVEDMQAQYQEFMAERESQSPTAAGDSPVPTPEDVLDIGVVVVAAGQGLADVFRSLGASAIIEGGQTMNPSTAQILQAVERLPSPNVIILPNNKNILMAAQQAATVAEKSGEKAVVVVPTRTIPQGVAALLTLDQSATLDSNATMMREAFQEVVTGEVTWATRDVELNGIAVREGDAIGLLDGVLVVDTASFGEAVHWLLAEADLDVRELVTLYFGEGVTEAQAQALADELAEAYADLEFEVVAGLQPHYPYILSIE